MLNNRLFAKVSVNNLKLMLVSYMFFNFVFLVLDNIMKLNDRGLVIFGY